MGQSVGYSYTGTVKGVTLKKAGYYKLEVWGAQGGTGKISTSIGGYGGYGYGTISASANQVLYVVVGGAGKTAVSQSTDKASKGYNGGGAGGVCTYYGAGGGGATHVAKRSGLLSNLSSYLSDVLIVAGGGGGGGAGDDNTAEPGGHGGGYVGGSTTKAIGGSQSFVDTIGESGTKYGGLSAGFGFGGDDDWSNYGADCGHSGGGGGGGYYGGGGGKTCCSTVNGGGGGSGYIGNSLLLSAKSVTKQMYMYNSGCSSSSAAATKTTCTNSTGAHVANAANTGNGYAKITYLGT